MGPQRQNRPGHPAPAPPIPPHGAGQQLVLRFCAVYFTLYGLASPIFSGLLVVPGATTQPLGVRWPMRSITIWCATHLLHVTAPLIYTGNSGDTLFHWIQTGWLLVVALVATGCWTLADRSDRADTVVLKWVRLAVRFGLAAQMFEYGMAKVIPTQFPAPALVTLVQPVGNLSLSGLFWTSVGASPAYEVFTGCVEIISGLLLLVPRTAVLGALLALANMLEVLILNLTYDIGLKQISFHLVLMSAFLLAPYLPRLASNLFEERAAGPSTSPSLFATRRANRRALAVQVAFGLYLLATYAIASRGYWYADGGGSPKSPLYGIWDVEQLAVDGTVRSPALNDYDRRWRRVIFDAPDSMLCQRTDDSIAHYGASIGTGDRTLMLTKGTSRSWTAAFTYQRPSEDELILDGAMDQHQIHARLRLVGLDTFRLLNSSFRWIRPPDFAYPSRLTSPQD